ncbi:MAG: DUF2520 domain-containing protein [Muribaculaceae bacterium]|nr:DUF2520 domain-containing protein [Muribaculaceae bacterium]
MGKSTHSYIFTNRQRYRVALIGAGNVAWHLVPAIAESHDLVAIYSRSYASADALAKKNTQLGHLVGQINSLSGVQEFADADIYIISVSDSALLDVVNLIEQKKHNRGTLFLHTSGSMPMNVLSNLSDCYGVFYPLQSFTKSAELNFREVPILIEANSVEHTLVLEKFASSISDTVLHINSSQRRTIHIAAVFACNFANALWDIAHKQLERENIPFSILMPLLKNTLAKLSVMTPALAQTGPAARGDKDLMQSHIDSLSGEEKEIYSLISNYILNHRQ